MNFMNFMNLIKNPLISGSAVLFIGSMAGNVFHFLFNVFMSRNLSVIDYGILVSLATLATLPGFLFSSVIPTTVNFATTFIANKEPGKLKGFYLQISKLMLFSGLLFTCLFFVFSDFIAEFLRIANISHFVIIAGFIVLFGFLGNVNMAFLQARLSFKYASFILFFQGLLKFVLGGAAVFVGFRVGGVLMGLVAAGALSYLIGALPLRTLFINSSKKVNVKTREVLGYAAPATFATLSVTSLINTDILLVKHFFPSHEAGLYAGLSLIGKVIFFFSSPIGAVMFPLIVKKHALGQKKGRMLFASLGLVLIPSVTLTLFYFLFPEFTIRFFLKREDYLALAGVLGYFSIFMTLYAILHILLQFYLSVKKTKIYIPVMIGAVLQIILISFFHDNFFQVITISASITLLLIVCLLVYYPHASRKKQ
jgi:O-antigen/teichoic acid export membrane protein